MTSKAELRMDLNDERKRRARASEEQRKWMKAALWLAAERGVLDEYQKQWHIHSESTAFDIDAFLEDIDAVAAENKAALARKRLGLEGTDA